MGGEFLFGICCFAKLGEFLCRKELLREALQFYKEHEYKITFLWTTSKLAAAGYLK
jgi:hypothetical protein